MSNKVKAIIGVVVGALAIGGGALAFLAGRKGEAVEGEESYADADEEADTENVVDSEE